MPCGATQDDGSWWRGLTECGPLEEGNGKPLQYSCLENPMNNMKRQNDRVLKWFAIPFSSGPHSVRPLHRDLPILGCPAGMALFRWVRQGCGLLWLVWLVFCEYGFSVSALWCPLATSIIFLGFLLPWAWGISSRLLQQSTAAAPYLGQRVSPLHRPSLPSTWDSSSRPACASAATAPWTWIALPGCCPVLRHGGPSPGHRPWTSMWGGSSRLSPLTSNGGWLLPATAPDFRHGVAPLGSTVCWPSQPLALNAPTRSKIPFKTWFQ